VSRPLGSLATRPVDRRESLHVPTPPTDDARVLLDGAPEELLRLAPLDLVHALEGPTLVRFPGTGEQAPRAVSVLLHGDESTGLEAMLRILRRQRTFPFDLWVLIGNVRAAAAGPGFAHRYLDDQEDLNRVWGLAPTTPLRRAAATFLDHLAAAGLESLVDVHNNTGDNPPYAIVTRERPETLNLATLFSSTLVRWDLGAATLMEALEGTVASIAIECGRPGRPDSLAFALDGLRRWLAAPPLRHDATVREHDLLGALRKVTVRPEVRLAFGGAPTGEVDLSIPVDAESHNFLRVPAGHVLGRVRPGTPLPLLAVTSAGEDVSDLLFTVDGDRVVTRLPVTPIMMTRSVEAVRKDCLFYVADELVAADRAEAS
jgi:hypothetical protein